MGGTGSSEALPKLRLDDLLDELQGPPEAAERLARTVDDLDTTLKIIRSAIFGLRRREEGPQPEGMRGRVATTVEAATASLGFVPALCMEGLLDSEVPQPWPTM